MMYDLVCWESRRRKTLTLGLTNETKRYKTATIKRHDSNVLVKKINKKVALFFLLLLRIGLRSDALRCVSSRPFMEVSFLAAVSFLECDK